MSVEYDGPIVHVFAYISTHCIVVPLFLRGLLSLIACPVSLSVVPSLAPEHRYHLAAHPWPSQISCKTHVAIVDAAYVD